METEKQKARTGKLYDANYDTELIAERAACKELCYDYNRLRPTQTDEKKRILSELLGKTGENFQIEPPFYCDYGYNIEIGENFYANVDCVILDGAKVTFGNNVFIAPNCGFYTAGHPLDVAQRNQGLEYAYPITIGNNVWIGAQACILPGVTIGDNTVIGAGSVVTKNIPDHTLWYGNPATQKGYITEDGILLDMDKRDKDGVEHVIKSKTND